MPHTNYKRKPHSKFKVNQTEPKNLTLITSLGLVKRLANLRRGTIFTLIQPNPYSKNDDYIQLRSDELIGTSITKNATRELCLNLEENLRKAPIGSSVSLFSDRTLSYFPIAIKHKDGWELKTFMTNVKPVEVL